MARLPIPGSDQGSWGQILNDYLSTSHQSDGSLKAGAVGGNSLADGSVTKPKLSATGGTNGQVLSTNGTNLVWATPSGSGAVPDADATTNGLVRLAGDLGGTAAAPTVPGLAGKANTSHTHAIADVTNLTSSLSGKANTSHTHAISDVTNLTTDLAGKANTSHTHTASNISDFNTSADARIAAASVNALSDVTVSSPSTGQVLKYNGSAWVNDVDATSGGSGATNLTATRNSTSVTVVSDTGTDAALAAADSSNAGVLTSADKTKLDGIATSATANSADATLLNRANHTGTQAQSTVTNLTTDLAGKAATSHTHAGADIASGTVAVARLGSGTPSGSNFLRGDGTWAVPAGGGGGSQWTHVHRTTAYTAASGEFITVDGTAAGFTVTLPTAAAGAYVYVKKIDATVNGVILQPQSGQVDGTATVVVNQQWEGEYLISNGTNWFRA